MKTYHESLTLGELIVICGMVTAAIIAGLLVVYINHKTKSSDRNAEFVSVRLSRIIKDLVSECSSLSCRNTKELIESLSEKELNYLNGNSSYRLFADRNKILIRKVGGEWWSCSRRGARPTENPDDRFIYRVSSEGEILPTIIGICTGREYSYFAGERIYSGSIIGEKTPNSGNCGFIEPEYWITIGSKEHLHNIEKGHKHNP